MAQKKPPLFTTTGGLYQPARVYYQVFQKKTVVGAFKRLRCMAFDPSQNRWVWLYEQEAKKLKFKKPYNQIPRQSRPVVIGAFTFRGEAEMRLDLRSFDRVTKAIEFFDKHINRRAAKVAKLRVVNKLFSSEQKQARQLLKKSFDDFFDREDIPPPKAEALIKEIERLKEADADIEKKRQAAFNWLEQLSEEAFPEVEELPIHFYEDGISQLELMLSLRQIEAMEHWRGNTKPNPLQIIQQMMSGIPDN